MKSIFIIFFYALNIPAFTLNNNVNLAFNHSEVFVNVASGFCSNIGSTDSELLSMVEEAVNNYWNKSPTSSIKLRKGKLVSVSANFKTGLICNASTDCDPNPALAVDKDILISCNTNTSNFSSSSVLAVTVPNNIEGTSIIGSLVILNDNTPTNQLSTKSRSEKVAILAHELGHTIGLGHSKTINSLMYYAVVPNRRSLGQDDIDGVTYLYPKEQPIACGSIQDVGKNNKSLINNFIQILLGFILISVIKKFYDLKVRPRLAQSLS